ncbi:MAG: hypothetical protein HFI09_02415 [Bacilli bacterium]|nr:hypothetical protein [Bacilli bacterium]
MIYFYHTEKGLLPFDLQQKNSLVYQNIQDLRNYAFLYVYQNGDIDAVIRTSNLREHHQALMPLSQKDSSPLKSFAPLLIDDITHYDFDEAVTLQGTLQIYYSISDLSDQDAFGFINAPATLSDLQKQFIRDHLPYFQVYQEILINQIDETTHHLKELNFMGDGSFLNILTDLSEISPDIHKTRS